MENHKDLTFKLIQRMAEQFYDLFHTGFTIEDQQCHAACIGSKGKLNWFSAICNLTRGYEMKSTNRNVPCCHYCMFLGPGLPAEDITSQPAWLRTMFQQRPWSLVEPPAQYAIPSDSTKPESLYLHDIFNTIRLGVFRDFIGSILFDSVAALWGWWYGGCKTGASAWALQAVAFI